MRKIAVHMETDMAGSQRDDVIEVEDDATDEEIQARVDEWLWEIVSYGWEDAPADAEVTA